MLNGPCTCPVLSYSANPPNPLNLPKPASFRLKPLSRKPRSPHNRVIAVPSSPLSLYPCLLYLPWPFCKR
jgi:hypothetical protein